MAYAKVSIPELLGLNLDDNPDRVGQGELRKALNTGRRDRFVGTRPGVAALGTGEDYENAIDEGNTIRGSFEYRQNFDQGRRLLVIADHTSGNKLFYEDNARINTAAVTITAASDYIYTLAEHNNVLWGTGGPPGRTAAVTESTWSWDGNVANPVALRTLTDKGAGVTLRPKFFKSKFGFLLAGGFQETTAANQTASNNPFVVRHATFATDPTNDANWLDSNTLGFESYGKTYFTGFGDYQDNRGDFLICGYNDHLAAYQLDLSGGFTKVDTIANGLVHQRAYVSLGLDAGDAIYVSEHGIHSLRQSQEHGNRAEAFLSWKIRSLFNGLSKTRLPFTVGCYDAQRGRVLFAMSRSGSATHDMLMCLDLKDQSELTADNARWYGPWVLGGGLKVNDLRYCRDATDNWHVYVFLTNGRVARLSDSVFADIGNGYEVSFRTKDDTYGLTLDDRRLGDTTLIVGTNVGGYNVTMRNYFDFGRRRSEAQEIQVPVVGGSVVGTGVVGTAVVGGDFDTSIQKAYTYGRGSSIGYEFTHSGTNQPFYVGRIDSEITEGGEYAGNEA